MWHDFHDEKRGRKDSWKRAIQALEYIQEAGMDPYMNVTVGHYNAKSEDLRMLLEYSYNNTIFLQHSYNTTTFLQHS